MKAQSEVYITLQNIYKAKARRDVDEVLKMVQAAPGGRDVDPAEVELFCKNAAFVKLINASDGGADRLATVTGKWFFSCSWVEREAGWGRETISRLCVSSHEGA
jgi:amyloid beta precursor protein binding protein 1